MMLRGSTQLEGEHVNLRTVVDGADADSGVPASKPLTRLVEAAMQAHKPQFIQINYSFGEREAEQRVLPLAAELDIAVLINRPFMEGRLFSAVRGKALPDWASEFADSWAQFFLKFIVSHPAVTCVIPATSKPHHMADNLGAGFGVLPDAGTREKMAAFWDSL